MLHTAFSGPLELVCLQTLYCTSQVADLQTMPKFLVAIIDGCTTGNQTLTSNFQSDVLTATLWHPVSNCQIYMLQSSMYTYVCHLQPCNQVATATDQLVFGDLWSWSMSQRFIFLLSHHSTSHDVCHNYSCIVTSVMMDITEHCQT